MKIYAFKIDSPDGGAAISFEEVINYLNGLPLDQRHNSEMRLEEVQTSSRRYRLEFSRLRNAVLPGKATQQTPTQALGLAANESVSEETAALFCSVTNTLVVQFNMFGPQRGSIQDYMNFFSLHAARALGRPNPAGRCFDIAAYINQNVQAQFNRLQLFRRLEMKVATPPVSNQQRQAGLSLGAVVDMGLAGGTQDAVIELSAGRKKASTLSPQFVSSALRFLRGSGAGHVEKLRVTGKQHQDAAIEELDLVDAILKAESRVAPGGDRRLPRFSRWQALEDTLEQWRRDGLLP
ncbi:MAG: hypothetical protein Q7Q73_01845 [Verrucomicrobiota bacterium JB024]|nr:hypothetical protein [Verrucomicrobiota bacterium JB024]